jgi:2,3-dihydroxybenzoate-AMP ligase
MLKECAQWPREFVDRYRTLGLWRDETIDEAVTAAALRTRDKIAIVTNETRITYAELDTGSERLANGLYAAGLRPGDRIVVQIPNKLEFAMLYLAASRLGVLPIMALPAHREAEIGFFLEHSEAVGYAIAPTYRNFDYVQMANALKEDHPSLKFVLTSGDATIDAPRFLSIRQLSEHHASLRPKFRADPFDVALFLVSGGTTGLPKLIPRTHADYLYNSRAMNQVDELDSNTIMLIAIPASHNFGLAAGLTGTLLANGTVVLMDSAAPDDVLATIERERVTCMPGVPALYIGLMERQQVVRRDLSSLRQIMAGGAKFLPTSVSRAQEVIGCRVQQVFGMTEGFIAATRLGDPDRAILETVGTSISPHDEYRVVDDEAKEVSIGEVGELLVRGPYTIRGYYKAADHNRHAFTEDGFYRTGDMVARDSSERLIVAGRVKDMINRAGEKVSAEEVENLVIDHPKVRAVALVAMSDPLMGEKGCLFVTCEQGVTIRLAEIVAHLEQKRVAKFKFPERLEVVDNFPLTAVGKIAKKVLRERIEHVLTEERQSGLVAKSPHSQEK